MSDAPKISIITACLNCESTITACLRSVARQTYSNVEHIVIDGGSTDLTLEVIAIEGAHIARLTSEKDAGIYDAMNKGLALATGEIIAFLNADDFYCDTNLLKRIAKCMQRDSLDVLFGDVEYFNINRPDITVRRYNSGNFSPYKLDQGLMPAHPSLFVRRTLFEKCGFFNINYKIAGDFDFIVRLFAQEDLRFHYLPEVIVRMKLGGLSTSGLKATILLNREIIHACRANGISTGWGTVLKRYPLKILEFLRL